MSNLSKGNLNEIASLYSGITLNESVEEKKETTDLSEEVLSEEAIQENSTFIFQVIGNHLIENKLADTPESAVKIMENMSDGWAEDILADYVASTDPELVEGSNPFNPRALIKSGLKKGFDYARGTLSPIIKNRLNIPAGQGLAAGVTKKVLEKGVDKGTQLVKDVVHGGLGKTGQEFYKQGRWVGRNLRGAVPLATTIGTGVAVSDLMQGENSFLKRLFKPNYSNAPQ